VLGTREGRKILTKNKIAWGMIPIKISLSDFCQIALKEFMEKVKKGKINPLDY